MVNDVYIAASLDGFIATADGGVEWLDEISNPDNSDFGYGDFMRKIDAIALGRMTYEKVLTFGSWPYEKPVFVLSNSLDSVSGDMSDKAEIIKGDPEEVTEQLHARGYRNTNSDIIGGWNTFVWENGKAR